jgi:hypothetical protein
MIFKNYIQIKLYQKQMANANQTYCCGSYILKKSLKKHLTTAKHANFNNRIRAVRNRLGNSYPDNTPVNQYTYLMDIEFLTEFLFPRINCKLVKHIVKTDCENYDLQYYAITTRKGVDSYDEDIYIKNGIYSIKVSNTRITEESPYALERTNMPDKLDDEEDDDDGYDAYVEDSRAVPMRNLLEVDAFIREDMKECFKDDKDEDRAVESLYYCYGYNMDEHNYRNLFFYFNRECKKDCRKLLVEGCKKLIDDLGMDEDEQDFESFDFWKLATSYAELYTMLNADDVYKEIIEKQIEDNKEMFNEVVKQINQQN